jgi:phosphoserine phosphatase
MTVATLGARELIDRLERLRPRGGPAALAFDADGTLWSGDVSEDVFDHAVRSRLLKTEAAEVLAQTAAEHGIAAEGSPSAIARALFTAYLDSRFGERDVCEMMTWCYAGLTPAELAELTRHVLERRNLGARLNRSLEPIFDYARAASLRTIVVSASPQTIVEQAAALWGFAEHDVIGARPALEAGRIAPRIAAPIPYAADKCSAARALLLDADWLASFGDNVFDVEMLCAARLGVAVNPRPELRMRLVELPGVVVLG